MNKKPFANQRHQLRWTLSFLFWSMVCIGVNSVVGEINIPDPHLETAIRMTLNKPEGELTVTDMESLTVLNARHELISNLSGLESAINLTELNVGFNCINDLNPISELSNLVELHAGGNSICDIGPLSGLVNLEILTLSGNQIRDLNPLSGLTNLRQLGLSYNAIRDPAPLATLINLQDQSVSWSTTYKTAGLDLDGNAMDLSSNSPARQVIDSLEALPSLRVEVNWQRPGPEILDPGLNMAINSSLGRETGTITFSELESLKLLDGSGADIVDLNGLEYATNLTILKLNSNRIHNVRSLAGFIHLVDLDIEDNLVGGGELHYLSGLKSLQQLTLGMNHLRQIEPLLRLQALLNLNLEHNYLDLTNISPASLVIQQLFDEGVQVLSGSQRFTEVVEIPDPRLDIFLRDHLIIPEDPLTKADLESLTHFRGNDLYTETLSGLEYAINLTEFKSSGWTFWDIGNIEALGNLDKVTSLFIGSSTLESIPDLSGMQSLQTAILHNNFIRDISGLANLPNVIELDLSDNDITNIDDLSGLHSLEILYLDNNYTPGGRNKLNLISDITPLAGLSNLQEVDLRNNIIDLSSGSANHSVISDMMANGVKVKYLPQQFTQQDDTWGPYLLHSVSNEKWVNSGVWMGWLNVTNAPWVYSDALDSWIYIPQEFVTTDGAWTWIPK